MPPVSSNLLSPQPYLTDCVLKDPQGRYLYEQFFQMVHEVAARYLKIYNIINNTEPVFWKNMDMGAYNYTSGLEISDV